MADTDLVGTAASIGILGGTGPAGTGLVRHRAQAAPKLTGIGRTGINAAT